MILNEMPFPQRDSNTEVKGKFYFTSIPQYWFIKPVKGLVAIARIL